MKNFHFRTDSATEEEKDCQAAAFLSCRIYLYHIHYHTLLYKKSAIY